MPTTQAADQVSASPWQDLGGCLIVPGQPTATCLTCGEQETADDTVSHFDEVPAPDMSVGRAISSYASSCRTRLGQSTKSAISYTGLWLLLAGAAEHATGEDRSALKHRLRMPIEQASEAARRLLAEPHPTVAAAVGAWAAADARTPLEVDGQIPSQDELDAWVSKQTRGLIERFPSDVDDETRLLLATALVLEPAWTEPLVEDESGAIILHGGLQTIVQTKAAGPVVVAKPHTRDAVDVLSIAADPGVPPSRVWRAVDEVVALLNDGALRHCTWPDDVPTSSATWRRSVEQATLMTSDLVSLPTDVFGRPRLWRSRLYPWTADATINLTRAPGVLQIVRTILPDEPDADVGCMQAVRAEYNHDGFRAAAVTSLMTAGSAPEFTLAEVERVELDFSGPHAVVAIARGGAWEGVPLVTAWVTERVRRPAPDADWEALELLSDTDPEEAAELRAYKESRMRERGETPPR